MRRKLMLVILFIRGLWSIMTPDRCQFFAIPQQICSYTSVVPDTTYQSLLGGASQTTNCLATDCTTRSFKDECDLCDSEICKKFCAEKKSSTKELFSFIREITKKHKKKIRSDSGDSSPVSEYKTVTVTKDKTSTTAITSTVTSTVVAQVPSTTASAGFQGSQTVSTNNRNVGGTAMTTGSVYGGNCGDGMGIMRNGGCSMYQQRSSSFNCGNGDERAICKGLFHLLSLAIKHKSAEGLLCSSLLDKSKKRKPEGTLKPKKVIEKERDDSSEESARGIRFSESGETEEESKERKGKSSTTRKEAGVKAVTVTRYFEKTKTIEAPLTLYREITTTITKEKPIVNYKVTTVTEKASVITKYETVTVEGTTKTKTVELQKQKENKTTEKAKVKKRVKEPPVAEDESDSDSEYEEPVKPKRPRKKKYKQISIRRGAGATFIITYPNGGEKVFSKCNFDDDESENGIEIRRLCRKLLEKSTSEETGELIEEDKIRRKTVKEAEEKEQQKKTVTVEKIVEKLVTTSATPAKTVTVEKTVDKPQTSPPPSPVQSVTTVTVEKTVDKPQISPAPSPEQPVKTVTVERIAGGGSFQESGGVKGSISAIASEIVKTVTQTIAIPMAPEQIGQKRRPSAYRTIVIPDDRYEDFSLDDLKADKLGINILKSERSSSSTAKTGEKAVRMICEDKRNRKFYLKKVGGKVDCLPEDVCADPAINRFILEFKGSAMKRQERASQGKERMAGQKGAII